MKAIYREDNRHGEGRNEIKRKYKSSSKRLKKEK